MQHLLLESILQQRRIGANISNGHSENRRYNRTSRILINHLVVFG